MSQQGSSNNALQKHHTEDEDVMLNILPLHIGIKSHVYFYVLRKKKDEMYGN